MPTEGARLRAAPGSWTGSGKVRLAYQWFRCDTMGADCTALGGATRQTRLLGGHDVGHTIGLQVRATDSHGSTTAYASLIGPVAGEPPLLSSRAQPVVSGAAAPGSTIRVDTGLWKPKPMSFSYQWVRCDVRAWACTPIEGDLRPVRRRAEGRRPLAARVVQARAGAVSRGLQRRCGARPRRRRGRPANCRRRRSPRSPAGQPTHRPRRHCRPGRSRTPTAVASGTAARHRGGHHVDPRGNAITYTRGRRPHARALPSAPVHRPGRATTAYGLGQARRRPRHPIVSNGSTDDRRNAGPGQTPSGLARWLEPNADGRRVPVGALSNGNGRLNPIAGATAPTYVITADDLGFVLQSSSERRSATLRRRPSAPSDARSRPRRDRRIGAAGRGRNSRDLARAIRRPREPRGAGRPR